MYLPPLSSSRMQQYTVMKTIFRILLLFASFQNTRKKKIYDNLTHPTCFFSFFSPTRLLILTNDNQTKERRKIIKKTTKNLINTTKDTNSKRIFFSQVKKKKKKK